MLSSNLLKRTLGAMLGTLTGRATVNGGNGNGTETEMETEMEKGRQNYKLQSSRGEVSLSVVVCNCYLARTVIVI